MSNPACLIILMTLVLIGFSTINPINEIVQLVFHKENTTAVSITSSRRTTVQLNGIERYDKQYWLSASEDNDFIQYGRSQLMTGLNVLQINFSNCIEAEILWSLHTNDLSNDRVTPIQELIKAAGGDKLMPVYELSQEEIMQDKYGFARSFKLSLKPETDLNKAIEILQSSSLIERVKPVGIQKIF